jgi:glycosyltransferase involved in cell wall biosynthesis
VPEVTVVVPTHDRLPFLSLTLHSALSQRDVDLEIVVVDDASSDGTAQWVARHSDGRVRVISNVSSRGVSVARNQGIEAATGTWVAFLDDDDLWAPDKLARQMEALLRSRRRWAYAGDVLLDERLRVIGGSPPPGPDELVEDLSRFNSVPAGASNVVVHAEVLEEVGGFDPGLSNNEDWDLWIRLARAGLPTSVPHPLVALRLHPGNASHNMRRMLEELDVIESRYDLDVDRPKHLRWAAWTALLDDRRKDAFGFYAAAARVGDLGSIPRALAALAIPRPSRLAERRRQSSSSWESEAEGWLRVLSDHALPSTEALGLPDADD